MAGDLTTRRAVLPARASIAATAGTLDRPLEGDAELLVTELESEAIVVGAFGRHHGCPDGPRTRRISGGPWIQVHPGTLHVVLSLAHPAALVPCDARRIVNRYVRPLLRGLTRGGALAHYFGRDWISVGHRPVGQVGFAHDSRSRRTVFEAFVGVKTPVAPAGRATFLGKEPASLEEAAGRAFSSDALASRIVEAYADAGGRTVHERALDPARDDGIETWDDPPWKATVDEAIGVLGAGVDRAGAFRLGGDLLVSRDALERVVARVVALSLPLDATEVGSIIDAELAPDEVALEGIRDLGSVRDVLVRGR